MNRVRALCVGLNFKWKSRGVMEQFDSTGRFNWQVPIEPADAILRIESYTISHFSTNFS